MPAAELPWLRPRELLVHTVDLDYGVTFADLLDDFHRNHRPVDLAASSARVTFGAGMRLPGLPVGAIGAAISPGVWRVADVPGRWAVQPAGRLRGRALLAVPGRGPVQREAENQRCGWRVKL